MSWPLQLWVDLPLRIKGLVLVAVPLAALGSLTLSLRVFHAEHARADAQVNRGMAFQKELGAVLPALSEADASVRGFLLLGQDELLEPYRGAREKLMGALDTLDRTASQDAARSQGLLRLRPLVEKELEILLKLRQFAAIPGFSLATAPPEVVAASDRNMKETRRVIAEIAQREEQILQAAVQQAAHAQGRADMVILGTLLLGLIGGISGVWLLMSSVVNTERKRAQAAVQQSHAQLERLLEQAQAQAANLAKSESAARNHKLLLESVLNSLTDGVALLSPNAELLLCNPAAERIFPGLRSVAPARWIDEYGLRAPGGGLPGVLPQTKALAGEKATEQILCVTAAPSETWVRLAAYALATPDNEAKGALVVFTDITASYLHQEILSRAKDEAEQANVAKSEFLSRMSHELRTPLNAILGFAQLLEMARLRGPHRDSVGQILKAGRHLLTLINEVLDISRIESGKLSLSPEAVNVSELVEEALAMVRPVAAERQIRIDMQFGQNVYMMADRQRLKQVLLNLLSNAIKYNRQAGTVTVAGQISPAERLRLNVSDTGQGIPADKMDRLFQPFDRLGADQSGIEGTGIGLALSKRLIEAMGGGIGAESRAEAGSTFWIEMPLAEGPLAALDRACGRSVAVETAATQQLVLYIEDNPSNVQLVERILEARADIRLLTASHGAAGIRLAQEHQPSLILLDVHLPDMDGKEVLDQLQAGGHTCAIPVIVVSADATARQETRLREAGAADYMTKPLDIPKFCAVVEEHLQHARVR